MTSRFYEFFRFCLVGGFGLLVDACFMELFVHWGLQAPIARLGSMAIALQCNYLLHARFTFHHAKDKPLTLRDWSMFMLVNATGAAVNYLVFLAIWKFVPLGGGLIHRQIALAGGTGVGLMLNYWSNRRFVFLQQKEHD